MAAYLVAILSVGSSILAALLVIHDSESLSKFVVAVIAILPALVSALIKVFDFEQKALWHWDKLVAYRSLLRKFDFEEENSANISRELSILEAFYQKRWVTLRPLNTDGISLNSSNTNSDSDV